MKYATAYLSLRSNVPLEDNLNRQGDLDVKFKVTQ